MNRFRITGTPLAGLMVVERQRMGDSRGFLTRLFCFEELKAKGWTKPVAQINHTYTKRQGTVRGLHFQYPPHAEMKLISCLRGDVWDVAVDLRKDSRTFLQWHAVSLSNDNNRALLIPEGFAHGFQTMSDDVELLYCHSEAYAQHAESGLHPQDVRLAIDWPLPLVELSARDMAHQFLDENFEGVQL